MAVREQLGPRLGYSLHLLTPALSFLEPPTPEHFPLPRTDKAEARRPSCGCELLGTELALGSSNVQKQQVNGGTEEGRGRHPHRMPWGGSLNVLLLINKVSWGGERKSNLWPGKCTDPRTWCQSIVLKATRAMSRDPAQPPPPPVPPDFPSLGSNFFLQMR